MKYQVRACCVLRRLCSARTRRRAHPLTCPGLLNSQQATAAPPLNSQQATTAPPLNSRPPRPLLPRHRFPPSFVCVVCLCHSWPTQDRALNEHVVQTTHACYPRQEDYSHQTVPLTQDCASHPRLCLSSKAVPLTQDCASLKTVPLTQSPKTEPLTQDCDSFSLLLLLPPTCYSHPLSQVRLNHQHVMCD